MADPRTQQAIRAYRAGKLGAAERMAREVLAQRKHEGDALALMGMIEFDRGHYDRAVEWHEQAVRVERRVSAYHTNLAQALTAAGKSTKAMASYERALKLDPNLAEAVAGRSELLERRGRAKRARALLEPFMKSGRATPRIALVYLRLAQRDGEDVTGMVEAQLARSDVDDRPRRSLLLLLGRARDRTGDYDGAFEAYAQANEIGAPAYDPSFFTDEVDAIIREFSRDAIAALPRSGEDSELPVFVVGMPRCGSTLIEQIIHAHPQGHGAGEVLDLVEIVRSLPDVLGSDAPFPADVESLTEEHAAELAGRFLDGFRRYAPRATRIVDKNLGNFKRLGLAQLLLPRARVIHARRHPLDLCLSCWFQNLSPLQQPYSTDLRHLGLYYRDYDRLMAHWRETLDMRMLEVDYETLVSDQETESRRIIEFLGLPWDDRCLRFHEAKRDVATLSHDQVSRPIYATAVKRYERYDKHLGPLKDALGIMQRTYAPRVEQPQELTRDTEKTRQGEERSGVGCLLQCSEPDPLFSVFSVSSVVQSLRNEQSDLAPTSVSLW